eukprot:scaffold8216_cov58-Isochrysis_galbana.AAC.1
MILFLSRNLFPPCVSFGRRPVPRPARDRRLPGRAVAAHLQLDSAGKHLACRAHHPALSERHGALGAAGRNRGRTGGAGVWAGNLPPSPLPSPPP